VFERVTNTKTEFICLIFFASLYTALKFSADFILSNPT